MTIIKTPDQKVRVFISSTINELSAERKAARNSISNLRLIPVFFEAGARPHPPKDLYTAYLEQSHIFVGIYWNSYGWVAPGSEISGLEDEYRLCGNKKPKLIYVKNSIQREEKLNNLLKEIQDSNITCYQKFNTPEELETLLANDLSVLMSEIFETALFSNQDKNESDVLQQLTRQNQAKIELPLIKSDLIGRDDDIKNIQELLLSKNASLVNISGAGGTGKTSLAIHVAHAIKNNFENGAVFVPLAPVTDSTLVASTISNLIELQDSGKQDIQVVLTDYLADKKMLLVLDNFEQITEAADLISTILAKCPDIKIIVTSRATLHIRGENIYQLSPLALNAENTETAGDEILKIPAVELFVIRAREVNNSLLLNDENARAILEICSRLDGLPLAIELAASRTKLFQPAALLNRMNKSLDLLSKGQRDLPQRQQTLRNTIEWSYNLLDDESKYAFRVLGAFKRSWTLEASDAIINGQNGSVDIESVTEKLLDVSLIKPTIITSDVEPRFNMLQTVHEYANEMLDASNEALDVKLNFANYFLDLFSGCENELWYANAEIWLDKIEEEFQNLRAAFYILIENNLLEKAWKLFYLIVPYWHIRGGYSEGDQWLTVAGVLNPVETPEIKKISKHIRANTYLWAAHTKMFLLQIEPGYQLIHKAEEIFRELNNYDGLSIALAIDGGYGVYMQLEDAPAKIAEAEELLKAIDNPYAKFTIALWPSEYYRHLGQMEKFKKGLEEANFLAAKYGMNSMKCYITLIHCGMLTMENKWDEAAQLYLDAIAVMPEKGLRDFKGGFILGYCQCLWKTGRLAEAEKLLLKGLEFVREGGQKESLFHSVMGMVEYFKMKNEIEVALKLYGTVEKFIEISHYPLSGASLNSYENMKAVISPELDNPNGIINFEAGRQLTLEEAILLAVKTCKSVC